MRVGIPGHSGPPTASIRYIPVHLRELSVNASAYRDKAAFISGKNRVKGGDVKTVSVDESDLGKLIVGHSGTDFEKRF